VQEHPGNLASSNVRLMRLVKGLGINLDHAAKSDRSVTGTIERVTFRLPRGIQTGIEFDWPKRRGGLKTVTGPTKILTKFEPCGSLYK
jgi:hypothetical protein